VSEGYIQLGYWQVALAAGLILFNGLISVALDLGLHRRLLLASVRTVIQLSLVGFVLQWVFSMSRWYGVVGLALAMVMVAGLAAAARSGRRYVGMRLNAVLSVWMSSWVVTGVALFGIIDVDPWYMPQYAIPLLGMMLGNTLNGISLGLDRFGDGLVTQRHQVEALLAMGATRWEAALPQIREAVRTGMIPILNAMMVVGLVSLPGMMTGQILAGIDPLEAVKYQIVIMFMIAAATSLGTVSVVLLSYRRLFDHRHRLRRERLRRVGD
jgi:putative ABC transport system permease protein